MQQKTSKGFTFGNGVHVSGALGRLSWCKVQDEFADRKTGGKGITNGGAWMKIQLSFWLNLNQFLDAIGQSLLLYQRNCPKAAT